MGKFSPYTMYEFLREQRAPRLALGGKLLGVRMGHGAVCDEAFCRLVDARARKG